MSTSNNKSPNDMKQLIKDAFKLVLDGEVPTKDLCAKYFSEDYIQRVDGKTLNFSDFVLHMEAQKKVIASAKITFKYLIAENNMVASLHIIEALKKDGSTIRAQVNAIFLIKDHKIICCDELTHLIEGGESDKDLGSRTE